ncbi:plasmid stabilization protein [Sphingomonas faeni]|uniref:plasmid stabilization protein n=1 Tax=Sphingomonas faeni TaxID=185950 RepID=UPI0020C7A8FF|nr:plasmid stabilization protein [Sphingomonas faeni]MCP8889191.1 plasmid stabilization protein [Sphingomonas faeni]
MPQGDKDAYTDKQKRKAAHIADGYAAKGVPEPEAEARAWATVNKDSGGGNKSGSGRGKPDMQASARSGGKQAAGRSDAAKSAAAKKGWETRRKKANG